MSVVLAKNWWSLVLRGLAAILLGVVVFVRPRMRLDEWVLLFSAYAMFDGLLGLAGAVRAAERHERWAPLMIEGLAGVVAAIVVFSWPAISAVSLVYVIAAWALVTGVFEIAAAVRLRNYVAGEWLFALSGIASLILGALMIAVPLAGGLPVAYWIAVYGLVSGTLLIGLGCRLKKWAGAPGPESSLPAPSRV